MGLDSLDPSFSVLVDMVIQEQDIMESEAIAKIKKQAKGLKGGRK